MSDDPPRNGEGDRVAQRRGGGGFAAGVTLDVERVTLVAGPPPPSLRDGPPPRAGEEQAVAKLLGIARHGRPKGPMETIEAAAVTLREGIHGDFRGSLKPGRNKRQVTVMRAEDWTAALDELGAVVEWQERRVNLIVAGLPPLEGMHGATLRFGDAVTLEISGECDPCFRMEEVQPGLKAVLIPHWRGGVCTRVTGEGRLTVGDEVRIETA